MNILSLTFLGVLFFLSIGLITSILRPVHRMGRMTKAIAGGDLDMKLDYQSKDELGNLGLSKQDENDLVKVFSMGFTTRDEANHLSGRGLGLDIVRDAVEGMGGRIEVVTAPGAGSTFTVVLPA